MKVKKKDGSYADLPNGRKWRLMEEPAVLELEAKEQAAKS